LALVGTFGGGKERTKWVVRAPPNAHPNVDLTWAVETKSLFDCAVKLIIIGVS
jgi:hypothetical protein